MNLDWLMKYLLIIYLNSYHLHLLRVCINDALLEIRATWKNFHKYCSNLFLAHKHIYSRPQYDWECHCVLCFTWNRTDKQLGRKNCFFSVLLKVTFCVLTKNFSECLGTRDSQERLVSACKNFWRGLLQKLGSCKTKQ